MATRATAIGTMAVLMLVVLLGPAARAGAVELRLTDDARTSSTQPNQNFGTNANLRVSSVATSYVKFDFSTLPAGLVGGDVAKATVKLWADSVAATGSFDVRRVTGTWSEDTITWNTAPALGAVDGTGTVGEVFSFVVADVTQLVKEWLDGVQANHGLALVASDAMDVTFDSKEDPQRGHEPQLEIVLAAGGLEASGTVNAIPKFTSATTLGDSVMSEINGNVGIGTANPATRLDVSSTNAAEKLRLSNSDGPARLSFTEQEIRMWRQDQSGAILTLATQLLSGTWSPGAGAINFTPNNSEAMRITAGGNVGIGTTAPTSRLHVVGDITATGSKNFQIAHPVEPDRKLLVHSALEGPEVAVFYRGEAQLVSGEIVVTLPAYFEALTRKDGRTVQLTPIGGFAPLYIAGEVDEGRFTVRTESGNPTQHFYWEVKAVRVDIPALVVEKLK